MLPERTADRAEGLARRLALAPALGVSVMALLGLRNARRHTRGRGVGKPYREIPWPVFAGLGALYTILGVQGWRSVPFRLPPAVRLLAAVLGLSLYGGGMGFIFAGRVALADMYNLSATTGAELYADHRLVTHGPFALVRHPMYLGATLAALGALLLYRTWTLVLIGLHIPAFFIRARREEEVLEQEFGDEWRAYCARVPAGVPGLPGRAVHSAFTLE